MGEVLNQTGQKVAHGVNQDAHEADRKRDQAKAKDSSEDLHDRAKAAGSAMASGAKEVRENIKKEHHLKKANEASAP